MLDHFAGVFTVLDAHTLRVTVGRRVGLLFDAALADPQVRDDRERRTRHGRRACRDAEDETLPRSALRRPARTNDRSTGLLRARTPRRWVGRTCGRFPPTK